MNPSRLPLGAAIAAALSLIWIAGAAPPARSQQSWAWPERAKNLKVLPKGTPADRLRSVMMGFTRGLGVRCQHCHVGQEGQPLSTFDFASDKNPKKAVARGMLRMVTSVNEQVRRITPAKKDRVEVMCQTCHRGRPVPMTLVEELTRAYSEAGADSAVAQYRVMRARFLESGSYDFREPSLTDVARHALERKDAAGAITIFRAAVEQFPESSRAHDGMGEAYLAAGDTARAIESYEKSIQLEPRNQHAADALKAIRPAR